MANPVRPLMQWMRLHHHHCCFSSTFQLNRLLLHSPHHFPAIVTRSLRLPFTTTATPHSSRRNLHVRPRGLRLPNAPPPSDLLERDSDSDSDAKKSRNEKKREARRAVRWGMDLAAFSTPQIKRILRIASLEPEVFEALMVVKRFGRDVREGKRRQFNYIGRLLRAAEPELMDSLIQATKDGDMSMLQALSGFETHEIKDDNEEADETEIEVEEEEGTHIYTDTANRWFGGLIAKDINIMKEIYSVQSVDFDRQKGLIDSHSRAEYMKNGVGTLNTKHFYLADMQGSRDSYEKNRYRMCPHRHTGLDSSWMLELRKLVRKVHAVQDRQVMSEESVGEIEPALLSARRALTNFLRDLAKRLPTEEL